MISINGINWKMNNIPERLILKHNDIKLDIDTAKKE